MYALVRAQYGVPRQLGVVIVRGHQLRLIIPRVHSDRKVAQFRVVGPEDSLLRRYLASKDLQHMMQLDATVPRGAKEKLHLRSLDLGQVREPPATRFSRVPCCTTCYAM